VQINQDIFIKEMSSARVLTSVTKYCSKCYKEFSTDEELYLNSKSYEYICSSCACCISEELETKTECVLECEEPALF